MNALQDPTDLISRYYALHERKNQADKEIHKLSTQRQEVERFLSLESRVLNALDALDQKLFQDITTLLENKLTIALQEVLEQNICLKVESVLSNKTIGFNFSIQRDGHEEHIIKGCGGSVANILSVGLRLFALTCLDEKKHRRFLVLDEQDCWMQPEIMPKFIKIIKQSAEALNFQILMISHHESDLFLDQADRVFHLIPGPEGIKSIVLKHALNS